MVSPCLLSAAPGSAEARRSPGSAGGTGGGGAGPGAVRPAGRWDLPQKGPDGRDLCPSDRQEAPVSLVRPLHPADFI